MRTSLAAGPPARPASARLVRIVVDRLLAEDHQLRLLLSTSAFRIFATPSGSTLRSTRRGSRDPRRSPAPCAAFPAARRRPTPAITSVATPPPSGARLLHRDFVERVHRHLHVRDVDASGRISRRPSRSRRPRVSRTTRRFQLPVSCSVACAAPGQRAVKPPSITKPAPVL